MAHDRIRAFNKHIFNRLIRTVAGAAHLSWSGVVQPQACAAVLIGARTHQASHGAYAPAAHPGRRPCWLDDDCTTGRLPQRRVAHDQVATQSIGQRIDFSKAA
jgi:hypothetical protein